jgi:hypothetical protein
VRQPAGYTGELDLISEALLAVDQQGPTGEIAAVPQALRKIPAFLDRRGNTPAPFIGPPAFFELPNCEQHEGTVPLRLGIIRFAFNRRLVADERLLQASLAFKGRSQIDLRLGKIRFKRERPVVILDGLAELAVGLPDDPAVVEALRIVGLEAQRAFDLNHGRGEIASLLEHHAKQIMRDGLGRVGGDGGAVKPLGFRQIAGLMPFDRRLPEAGCYRHCRKASATSENT